MKKSIRTIYREGIGAFGQKRQLIHISAGYEIAGSGTRETGECWASTFECKNGIKGGQRYKLFTDAETDFLRYTTPIVEVKHAQ